MNYKLTCTYRPTGFLRTVVLASEHDANVALVEATKVFPLSLLRLTDFDIQPTDEPVSKLY